MTYSRAALEWDLVGGDPTPGDPNAYDMLSGFFGGTAENAAEAARRLRALALNADDSVWRGGAADAFREDLGSLPKNLDRLHDSYQEASDALRSYGVSLRQLQTRAGDELTKAVAADDEITAITRQIMDAQPPIVGGAPLVGIVNDPTEEARGRLAAARTTVEQIRQDREADEQQCVTKLNTASDLGLHNKSLMDRIGGWAGDRIDDIADIHHKMLRAIGDLADRIADVITVVAIALAAVATIAAVAALVVGSGGTAAPFIAAFAGAAWTASGTAFLWAGAASAVSVGAKVYSKALYNDPDLAWGQLAKDGALAALTVAGGPVKAANAVKGTRAFHAAAAKMGQMALSGNRVAQFSIKGAQFATLAATKYQAVHTVVMGADDAPTLVNMSYTTWKESKALWDKHKDDPLHIFTDPIQTEPGQPEETDSAGVMVRDIGRAVLSL